MNLVRRVYTLTADDINNQVAVVSVLWRSKMPSSQYALTWCAEDLTGLPAGSFNFIVGDTHDITASGFNAVIYVLNTSALTPGMKVAVRAMAAENTH